MKTSAISTPANLASGSAAARQPDATPETPFSQLLSREMAAQPAAHPAANAPAKEQAPQAGKETQAARQESGADSPDAAAKTDAGPAQESTGKTAAAKKTAAADDEKPADNSAAEDDPATAASDELLALVASLTQPATKAATDAGAADEGKQTPLDATDDGAQRKTQPQDVSLLARPDPGLNLAALAPPRTDNPAAVRHSHGVQDEAGIMAAASGAMRRGVGIEADGAKRAAAPSDEAAPEAGEFDARLAQAKDEKAAAAGGKVPLQYADPAAAQRAERPAAKAAQDLQPPVAAQINGSALTAPPQLQLQPAAMPAQAAEMLAPRVGSQGWDQALGQKVVWMVSSDVQSASLTLNPPDLGPLQVVLHVSDNQATANFTAAQPEVRHALESALPKLREMLGDAGIQLSQANVNAGNPNSNPQHAFGQPQQSSRSGGAGGQPGENSDAPVVRAGRGQTIASGRGLVDTFV